jgi:hypothetical protein
VVNTTHIFLDKKTISLRNKVVSMWMEEKLHRFRPNPCKMLWNIWLLHLKPSMVQVVHGDRGCGFSCDLHPMMNEPLKKIHRIQFTGPYSPGSLTEKFAQKKKGWLRDLKNKVPWQNSETCCLENLYQKFLSFFLVWKGESQSNSWIWMAGWQRSATIPW